MVKLWIIIGIIFMGLTLLTVKLTFKNYKKENSDKMWKLWGMRTMYWQGVIIISSGLTILIIILFKWAGIFYF